MPKKKIFVASSSEAKTQAKALIKDLALPTIEFIPWWDSITPGHLLLNDLNEIKEQVSAALMVFTPDILATMRGSQVTLPNQNVLFELGYFFSALDPSKIALIKYGTTYIPKDLDGYTHIPGSKFFKPKASVVAGVQTKNAFNKWVAEL